jgi:hypothetical protein
MGVRRNAIMAGKKAKTKKDGEFNYYWYSRCRYWDVSIIPQLALNISASQFSKSPKQGPELDRCFKAIRQGIESGHLTPRKGSPASPWSKGRALFSPALQGWMEADKQFYRTQLLTGQVFNWLVFTHKRDFKYAPEFLEMDAEIYPYDFANQVGGLPAWAIPNIIRIVFGERYKEWSESPAGPTVTKFLEFIKSNVSAGKLKPLHLLPSENINEWEFRPIEIIEFIASESFESWRQTNRVDVLEWVSTMFEKIEKESLQQNHDEKVSAKEKSLDNQAGSTKKPGKRFLPAPIGTKWGDVKIEITPKVGIKIWVKGKSKTYNLEKFKKEIFIQPKMRDYLFQIIQFGRIFTQEDIAPKDDNDKFRNYISRLRKQLQEVFGIQEDPLLFQNQSYHAQFKLSFKVKT